MRGKSAYFDDQEWQKQKRGLIKQKFTEEEDNKLRAIIENIGTVDWKKVANQMKSRNARQCRERWNNYLNPDLNDAPWTPEEDKLIEELYEKFGTQWNKIGKHFDNRSDNSLRNRWMKIKRSKKRNALLHKTVESPLVGSPPPKPTSTVAVNESFTSILENLSQTFDLFGDDSVFSW